MDLGWGQVDRAWVLMGGPLASVTSQELCDPVDFSLPSSSVHGSLQARILE